MKLNLRLFLLTVIAFFAAILSLASFRFRNALKSPKVFIFEEHHEVLEAWFSEFKALRLSLPTTVIHIDAHADLALPRPHPLVPSFRLPKSADEVAALMQKNDVFLLSSGIARMVDRIFWIAPSWLHLLPVSGLLRLGRIKNETEARFCLCGPESMCSAEGDDGELQTVTNCVTQTEISFSALRENNLKLLPTSFKPGGFILDIDEDFFGVQSVASDLLTAGFSSGDLQRLQSVLSPLQHFSEAAADCWFRALVRCKVRKRLACRGPSALRSLLSRFSTEQLHELARVGLCFNVSPKTFLAVHAASRPRLELCLGVVQPRGSLQLHKTTLLELQNRLQRLEALLHVLPRPSLVTVSRSARDGFVPRSLQSPIEAGIVAALSRRFSLTPKHFQRDNNLWRAWSCDEK